MYEYVWYINSWHKWLPTNCDRLTCTNLPKHVCICAQMTSIRGRFRFMYMEAQLRNMSNIYPWFLSNSPSKLFTGLQEFAPVSVQQWAQTIISWTCEFPGATQTAGSWVHWIINGGWLVLIANGAYSYQWQPSMWPATTISGLICSLWSGTPGADNREISYGVMYSAEGYVHA